MGSSVPDLEGRLAFLKGSMQMPIENSEANESEVRVRRAEVVLLAFAKAWELPLNPENLALMAHATTRFSDPDMDMCDSEIFDATLEEIEADASTNELMIEAMRDNLKKRH